MLAGGLLAVTALVLAGCTGTGNFDVQQTEPFRVQLEGSPQTVQVSESDASAKEVVVVTCQAPCDEDDGSCSDPCAETVDVKVHVTPATASACVIKVTIKDKVTGEILDTQEVDAGSGNGSASATSSDAGNGTTTVTQTETQTVSSGTVVQNFVVNVKGNHNIVVLTQAIEGSANVQVSASHATGNGQADSNNNAGTTASGSASASATDSTSQTSSTSPP